jgi:quercetin dioxygenase-like cupin family protein
MEDRRTFLASAAAMLMVPLEMAKAGAQTSTRPRGELARHALTGPYDGHDAVLVEVSVPAGSRSPGIGHRHTGPVLGYVLQGELRFAINNEPEKIVKAGGTFFEPIGALHSTSGATEAGPARFLAFLVVPRGADVVAPA